MHALSSPQSTDRPHLDLTPAGITDHWLRVHVNGLIKAMETTEDWPVDSRPEERQEVDAIVLRLGEVLNAASTLSITEAFTENSQVAVELMGSLRAGRAIALYAWLTSIDEKISASLMREAGSGRSDMGTLLIERIRTLERSFLLSRVFSPERLALVLSLLQEAGLSET